MKKIVILALLSMTAFGTDLHMRQRYEKAFKANAAVKYLAGVYSDDGGSLVLMQNMGHADHLQICSELTERIRYNFSLGSGSSLRHHGDYDGIIPAAASGSFVCVTLDDVELSDMLRAWTDDGGGSVQSGSVYGQIW